MQELFASRRKIFPVHAFLLDIFSAGALGRSKKGQLVGWKSHFAQNRACVREDSFEARLSAVEREYYCGFAWVFASRL
jgi:hypothetical protein